MSTLALSFVPSSYSNVKTISSLILETSKPPFSPATFSKYGETSHNTV